MRVFYIVLSLLFSTSAAFADISWHAGEMASGSVMVMKDRAGVTSHIKRANAGDLHTFQVFAGTGRSADYLGSYTVNGSGNIVETLAVDGARTSYSPHRCNRTLGKCSFVVTHINGLIEKRTRVTEEWNGGLRYREYGADGLMSEGALELDRIGASLGGWRKGPDGRKTRIERVAISLK